MNQDQPHSVQEPITEQQRPGDIPSKPKKKKKNSVAQG